jgi:predicted nucleotidyltransferase
MLDWSESGGAGGLTSHTTGERIWEIEAIECGEHPTHDRRDSNGGLTCPQCDGAIPVEVYRPERIYLFGSVARGEATADSDDDLMVVVPDDSAPALRDSRAGYRALREIGVPRDIFVSTSSDFKKQLYLKASFPSTVEREDLLLYSSSPVCAERLSQAQEQPGWRRTARPTQNRRRKYTDGR